jgi:uncharacterized protein (DUF1330 family)
MRLPRLPAALTVTLTMLCLAPASATPESLAPGNQLTFVLAEWRPGGEHAQKAYLDQAFPRAKANGMRELSAFKVVKTLVGGRQPHASGLYFWPSEVAAQRMRADDYYMKTLLPLRAQAWNELQSVDMTVQDALEVELDRSKTYTATLLWTKDAAGYDRVFKDGELLRQRMGARTVLRLPATRYETLKEGETPPPDVVVLIEWPSAEALAKYQADPAFAELSKRYAQIVSQIEWYQLGFWD